MKVCFVIITYSKRAFLPKFKYDFIYYLIRKEELFYNPGELLGWLECANSNTTLRNLTFTIQKYRSIVFYTVPWWAADFDPNSAQPNKSIVSGTMRYIFKQRVESLVLSILLLLVRP